MPRAGGYTTCPAFALCLGMGCAIGIGEMKPIANKETLHMIRVLIVEDQPLMQEMLADMLKTATSSA